MDVQNIDGYQVKGSSIRSKLLYVRERFGEVAEKKLCEDLDGTYFPILDSTWYPYDLHERLVKAIADKHLGGDLSRLREVGMFSAQSVLTGIYKFFATGKDFVDFLRRAEALHATCYNQGGMQVKVDDDRKGCEIWLSAPIFRDTDMHIAAGFYVGAAQLFKAAHVRCESKLEVNAARFTMRWS